jgi:hypothetical protein
MPREVSFFNRFCLSESAVAASTDYYELGVYL